jgi:RNA recognition motif-containing protein
MSDKAAAAATATAAASQHDNKSTDQQNNNAEVEGPTSAAKLFVGQIPYEADEQRLRELFGAYGNVIAVHFCNTGKQGDGGMRKGRAAFVTYSTTQEADVAVWTLHNRMRLLSNRPLQCSYAKNSPNISPFGRQMAIEVAQANHSNPMPM